MERDKFFPEPPRKPSWQTPVAALVGLVLAVLGFAAFFRFF
jgi:hypothetical protein